MDKKLEKENTRLEKENSTLEKKNTKLEKQNRKLKGRNRAGGRIILLLLLVIVILAAIMFFLDPFGWGIGPNAKSQSSGGSSAPASAEAPEASEAVTSAEPAETTSPEVTTTETEKQKPVLEVSISGETYLMDSEEKTIDDIVNAAKKAGDDVIVKIIDKEAIVNNTNDLTSALEKENIAYSLD